MLEERYISFSQFTAAVSLLTKLLVLPNRTNIHRNFSITHRVGRGSPGSMRFEFIKQDSLEAETSLYLITSLKTLLILYLFCSSLVFFLMPNKI